MIVVKEDILELFKAHGCYAASVFSFEESEKSSISQKDVPAFEAWLSQYAHAGMTFLEKNMEARKDPSHILAKVKTAIIFLFPYAQGHRVRKNTKGVTHFVRDEVSGLKVSSPGLTGGSLISRYAQGKDYHKVLKKNLDQIAKALQNQLNEHFTSRAVVDSIPFFDRAHAREAELGFVGKNTMLIRPGMGSFFFIATLLVDFSYTKIAQKNEKINPITNLNCGTCTKCMDACPTNALTKPYFLNASRCLSYLSIEHRDIVAEEYLSHFAKTIYGCDICQEVCPYNFVTSDFKILEEFSKKHTPFQPVTLKEIALMTQVQYEQWFGGTAVTRGKYQGLVRNALYHLYAVGHPELMDVLKILENSNEARSDGLISKAVKQIKSLSNKVSHVVPRLDRGIQLEVL